MTRPWVISGGSGTVGQHVVAALREAGTPVRVLSRSARPDAPGVRTLRWDPQRAAAGDAAALGELRQALEGADVVLNLAGESVAAGRLGGRHFARVLSSRVDATRALVQAQRACADWPSAQEARTTAGATRAPARARVGDRPRTRVRRST